MDGLDTSAATHRQVPAVTRAVAILRRLGDAAGPMGARELARELDLVPSTCLHILRVLTVEGLVEFDAGTKRYTLGVGILGIAQSAIRRSDFATLAQPMLQRLAAAFSVSAMATQLLPPQEMIVAAIARPRQPFGLATDLGSRFPELISATGRCVAAFNGADPATLEDRFDALPWDNRPDFAVWQKEVEQARHDGYAVDRANYLSGLTIVAVPVFDDEGRASRGLVTVGISETVEVAGVEAVAAELLRARDELAGYLMP